MRNVTLCILRRPGEILLAMKKRGFGAGRWNGVGGKQNEGESIEETALRETEEEIGVRSNQADLEKIGQLRFYFPTKPEWDQEVHIYFVNSWKGEPSESEEMSPSWFKHNDIPYKEMWPADIYWLPKALQGKRLDGEFYFSDEGSNFEHFELREIDLPNSEALAIM